MATTKLTLKDVVGTPCFLMELPSPLRLGEVLDLKCRLRRHNAGRLEELIVQQLFVVVATSVQGGYVGQVVEVESKTKPPAWRAVRKPPAKRLAPARSPRTSI